MIVQTLTQLEDFHQKAKTEQILVWDIESTGLIYYDRPVERFGLEDWEILPNGDWIIGHAFMLPSDGSKYYLPVRMNSGENLQVEVVNEVLQDLFGNSNKTVDAHNGKFDKKFVEKEGIIFRAFLRDTMLLCHAANENEESFGLKELGKKYVRYDADAEKLALEQAQSEWVTKTIRPIEDRIEVLEKEMTRMEREWKAKEKEEFKTCLAETRKRISNAKKEKTIDSVSLYQWEKQVETLRGKIEDINRRSPNKHLPELPTEFSSYKDERERLMDKINAIKRIKPVENLRNLPMETVAEYAKQDVFITHELSKLSEVRLERQGLLEIGKGVCEYGVAIGKMESNGMKMDIDFIKDQIALCDQKQAELKAACEDAIGKEINMNSHVQIKAVTGLESTAREFLEVSEHPIAMLVNDYRQWGRARDTYYKVFLEYLDANRRLHPDLLLLAVSGRAMMKRPSMNTLPRNSDIYNVRGAIVASPGYVLVECDLSQAELRLLAHLSNDPNLVNAYRNGIDIHSQTAEMISVPRQVAKRVNFTVVYGAGPAGLIHSLRMERVYLYKLLKEMSQGVQEKSEETGNRLMVEKLGIVWQHATEEERQEYLELGAAKNILDDYKTRFPLVEAYLKKTIYFAKKHRYIPMWTGRRRRFPDIVTKEGRVFNESRTAPNNQIQGGVSEIIRLAITALDKKFLEMSERRTVPRMIGQFHDSILFEIPEGEDVDNWIRLILYRMENVARFNVPFVADAKIGYRWNELKPWEGERK